MIGQSAIFATNPLCEDPGDQKDGSVEAITVQAAIAGRKPARIMSAQIVGPMAAHAGQRRNRNGYNARHNHAARQERNAQSVERLRKEPHQMQVAPGDVHHSGETHRRTDHDDE